MNDTLNKLIASRKAFIAALGCVMVIASQLGLPQAKADAITDATIKLSFILIVGIAAEDAAGKSRRAPGAGSPANQTNVIVPPATVPADGSAPAATPSQPPAQEIR